MNVPQKNGFGPKLKCAFQFKAKVSLWLSTRRESSALSKGKFFLFAFCRFCKTFNLIFFLFEYFVFFLSYFSKRIFCLLLDWFDFVEQISQLNQVELLDRKRE